MIGRYADADDLRRALDDRIPSAARIQGVAHDRLRKEIAFQRLVARFTAVDRDHWALKGGAALIWRIGARVSATCDVDSNWFDDVPSFGPFFDAALAADLGDAFSLEASQPTELRGEVERGHRYRMVAFRQPQLGFSVSRRRTSRRSSVGLGDRGHSGSRYRVSTL